MSGSAATPSLQDALETLQADFAALLQAAGVNTSASQSSASGSGTSATSGTQATSSSITAALQNFLQQLSQALSTGGQTYGRHHDHGHGHHHDAGAASSASSTSSSTASASNSGSGGQNIEIGIFIDITA
ncbi:MAG: hypothetical protein WAU49_18525 [Steroidobacteraceae bacterium]